MNPHDPIKRTGADTSIDAPYTPGAQVDVSNTSKTTKVTVSSKDGAVAKGWASRSSWPKDNDEWRRWVRSAIPWVAGAAIVLAAATSMKRNKDEEGYGKSAGRKARRAGEKAESALNDLEDRAERNWFGLKKNVEDAADEAGNKLENAKNAAARKTDDTRGVVREKAHDAKEGVKDAGRWVGNKAHDAADTAKSTYRSAADTTSRAANKVEDKVAAAGSAALATASSAEEKTGQFLKKGGEGLEKDGRQSKNYYRGQQVKEETKSKWGCSIM
ncbi:hypothetical protein Ndes2526B_g01701 [Nannochloris sp. 'desiccata']